MRKTAYEGLTKCNPIDIIILEYGDMKNIRKSAQFIKALAHPTRLAIVNRLMKGDNCVCSIERKLGLKQANVSQHLNILRSEGVVDYRVEGKQRCYFLLNREKMRKLMECIS